MPIYESFDNIVKAGMEKEWELKKSKVKNIMRLDYSYPLGLLSLAAYVSLHNPAVDIKILDCSAFLGSYMENFAGETKISRESFWEYCLSETGDFVPELIGLSAMFSNVFYELSSFAGFLSKRFPKSMIICGGHLASSCYEDIFSHDDTINAICYGEGEKPFLELVEAVCVGGGGDEYLETSDSWITKHKINNNKNFNPINNVIFDLDEIPPYNYDLIIKREEHLYLYDSYGLFSTREDEEKRLIAISTTRGCPAKCIFCASHHVHGRKVRAHSTSRIKQDILYYQRKWGFERFVFWDDHFLSNKKLAVDVLKFVAENNISATVATPAFFSLDKTIARLLKVIGVKHIALAIESGNEETLKNIIRKPGNLDKAKEAIKCLRDEGIIVYSNILVGLPGETKESIEKGVQGMLDLGCNWYNFFIVSPLPGSDLFKICKENNYIMDGVDLYSMDFTRCIIRTPDFEPAYIEWKKYEINLHVNFVKNYDMRVGNYETALMMFERVLDMVIDTHAFAYYFAAICLKNLGLDEKYVLYKEKYEEMKNKYDFWKEWVEYFGLKPLD